MQDLDPEEARAIIDPALKLMIDAVHRYDGYVVQSTGDGIFALFGAPVAHEDHPQRALYAALRMQEELRRYSAKLVAEGGNPIEARIGVNTGEVVVRSIATGGGQIEYTPIGHTANLAARMQAVAPTGSIAISEQTRKMVEGYFAVKPLGPTQGKRGQRASERVRGNRPGSVAHPLATGGGPRADEVRRARARDGGSFAHAAELARKPGAGRSSQRWRKPGAGKSRLFYEFKARNCSRAGWCSRRTRSRTARRRHICRCSICCTVISASTPKTTKRRAARKSMARIVTLDPALEDTLPYLFGLLGIVEGDDPLAQMDASGQEAAHARRDQTHYPAREPRISR